MKQKTVMRVVTDGDDGLRNFVQRRISPSGETHHRFNLDLDFRLEASRMSIVQLDSRAAAAFDARAEGLLSLVRAVVVTAESKRWQPEIVVKAQLGASDIQGEIEVTSVGPNGIPVATRFLSQGQMQELAGAGYAQLRKLAEQVARVPSLRASVSSVAVECLLRQWVRDRHRENAHPAFSEVMLEEFEKTIRPFTVWLPVQRLHIEQDFSFAIAWLKNVSKSMIDEIVKVSPPEAREAKEKRLRHHQGHAAVVIECLAEPRRAMELALEQAEAVLATLSLFTTGAACSSAGSSMQLWGVQPRRMASALFFVGDALLSHTGAVLEPDAPSVAIDQQFLKVYGPQLAQFKWLLEHAKPGTLAELVVDSLRMYRRATLTADPAEKITFVFAALEMVLVDGNKEPIQESIGIRIALLAGHILAEHKDILSTIRKAYSLRSAFVHHGVQIEDLDLANQLLVRRETGKE